MPILRQAQDERNLPYRLSVQSQDSLVGRGWPSEPFPQDNVIAQWVPASAGTTAGFTSFRRKPEPMQPRYLAARSW